MKGRGIFQALGIFGRKQMPRIAQLDIALTKIKAAPENPGAALG